jgi:transcriptional regulator with XRE-family HTH domain
LSLSRNLGDALRRARRARGLTLRDVEELSGGRFKPSVIGGYERAERAINVARLLELTSVYGIPADRVLAEVLEEMDGDGRSELVIDLRRLELVEERPRGVVEEFLQLVQEQRGDRTTDVLTLRSGDLQVMAGTSGLAPDDLLSRLKPALKPPHG